MENSTQKLTWPFWQNILRVEAGDVIIHLRGKGKQAAFVGYSIAEGAGHTTSEKPPDAGVWEYCETYHLAFTKDYIAFSEPIVLSYLFNNKDAAFRNYYNNQRVKHKSLFYTIQSGRLQCLNGAYPARLLWRFSPLGNPA